MVPNKLEAVFQFTLRSCSLKAAGSISLQRLSMSFIASRAKLRSATLLQYVFKVGLLDLPGDIVRGPRGG